jgi:hypothetical protein
VSSISQNAAPRESRRARFLPALLFGLLVVAAYADPIFLRKNFGGRDLLAYHLPIESAVHDAFSRGRLPVWISEISGGRPLMANPNVGALYPVRPLLSLLPFPVAMRIFPVLHWALAGVGMMLLLRSLNASRAAAWVGAVTYTFSGVSVSEVFYSNIHPGMALLPWVLWAFLRPMASRSRKVLVLSLLFALLALSGDVFTSGLAILCCLLWLVLEGASEQQKSDLVVLLLALPLAALAAAPQVLAAALWIPTTNRSVLGMELWHALQFSVTPFRLLEFVVPYPFGATWEIDATRVWGWKVLQGRAIGFFSTLYAGAFGVIALVSARRERARGARFARVLFLLGLAVTVLPSFLPESWEDVASPLPLRYPEKFAVAVVLAIAILSGLAFDRFRSAVRAPRWALAAGGVLALAAALAYLLPASTGRIAAALTGAWGQPGLAAKRATDMLPGALAEAGLFWMASLVAIAALPRNGRAPLAFSLILLTLVPLAANRRIARSFRQDAVFGPPVFDRYLARADPSGAYRTLGVSAYQESTEPERARWSTDAGGLAETRLNWDYYTHALWGRGTVLNSDFDVGDPSRLQSLRRISEFAATYKDAQTFYGALALRWAIRSKGQVALAGYHPFREHGLQVWDEHEKPYPDIRLVESWREAPSAVAALEAVPRLAPGEIVIESDARRAGSARPGKVQILVKTPEHLVLTTDSEDPTWLFVLRGYWDYRRVLLDGEPVEVAPAQLAFSAVRVPAGRHRIEWRELLPGLGISRWGPLLFAMAGLGLLRAESRGNRS